MSDNLDNLLVEAFAKNLFQDNDEDIEEGEVDKEEGEIDSGDDDKTDRKDSKSERHKHKKSKLKSKNKSNVESKSISKKLVKKSSKICSKISSKVSVKNNTKTKDKNSPNGKKSKKENSKHKKSKSGAKSDKIKHKKSDENDSEVMKLLLSKHFKSYADIEFKEEPMSPERERKKHSKHKSNKKENGRHEKSDRHSDRKKEHKKSKYYDDYYEKQKDSYYSTRSSTTHEDFFYGSYYEGSASVPSDRCRSIYSRPLSPLWDFDSRGRSRSRSPLDYTGDTRSLSPTCRYYALHASRSPGDNYRRHHRRSISPGGRSRRSCSVSSRRSVDRIDKQKLLEIARINLVKMIEKGDLPKGTDIAKLKLRHLRELTTQKSVQQWTEFCRAISALESAAADDSDLELDFDSDDDTRSVASELISIRHPFKVNERKDIQIRVRGFPQLPSRSAKEMAIELREQFPVSSGNQHRRKELDWTEIEPMPPPALPAPKPKTKKIETKLTEILNTPTNIPEETLAYKIIVPTTETITTTATSNAIASSSQMTANTAIETNDRQCPSPIVDTSLTNTTSASVSASTSISSSTLSSTLASVIPHTSSLAEIVGQPKPAEPQPEPEPKSKDSVFAQSSMPIDIGSVMAQRLSAIRKLEEDPYNVVALKQKYQADQMMSEWAESKIVPGQFIGSTGASVLTPEQLNSGRDAWTRKDQLKTAAPITDGIGMLLLLKMGWTPGTGLGKNNEGVVDPIMLDIKNDKKGLVAEAEQFRNLPLQLVSSSAADSKASNAKFLNHSGKNPVSILHELCAKKHWLPPTYDLVTEVGPAHRKNFTFKVIVNGVEYQPSVSSANKKQAKALAAGVCLQSFGLLPKDNT